MDELKSDVKEIKGKVDQLVTLGAVHNHLLKEHEARSIALQKQVELNKLELDKRLNPVEMHVHFINIAAKIVLTLGGFILGVAGVVKGIESLLNILGK